MIRPPLAGAGEDASGRPGRRAAARARGPGRLGRGARGALQAALAGRLPLGLLHRPRRGRRRGHRPGGVPRRGAGARPLRRHGARSRPGSTGSWSTARSTSPARARCGARWARSWPTAAEAPAHAAAISDELLGALAELAPEQRAVVVLRYLLDWTPGEIARALGHPARHRELAPAPRARSPGRRAGGGAMTERELRRALRERPVPGEREAAERTLRVLRAAHAGGRSGRGAPPPPAAAGAGARARAGGARAPCSARREPTCAAGSATASTRSPPPTPRALPAAGPAARELRRGQLGGQRGRLAAAPGRLLERGLVAARPLRGDRARAAPLRRRARRHRALVDRPAGRRRPPGLVAGRRLPGGLPGGPRRCGWWPATGAATSAWPGRWRR